MPALARMEASTVAKGDPIARDHGTNKHALCIASETSSPGSHNAPIQRSLPLLRVMRTDLSGPPVPSVDDVSRCAVTQRTPVIEQPGANAVDQGALAAFKLAPAPLSRRQLWSAASVSTLCADYPTAKLVRDISAELDRSVSAIYGKARRLNLKRPRRGAAPADAAVALSVPAPPTEASQPNIAVDPTPKPPPMAPAAPQLALPIPQPSPAQKVELTKLGGRLGCWTENDGALSERLERLFIANFSPSCIAAVLGVTERSAATRAWVVNCPRRDPQALRHDVEAARLVDRLAGPLPGSVFSWKSGKMLVRKRCRRKGHHIWGANGTTLSNDAKRQRSYKILTASAPMHAW